MPAAPEHPTQLVLPAGAPAVEAEPHRPRRSRRFAIWVVVLAAFAAVFWWALRGHAAAKARHGVAAAPAPLVITATARQVDLPIYLDAIGTVTPVYTDAITSQVTGRVVAVHYAEGQLVRAGAPLLDIDPRPFAATLLQAEGTLERDQHLLEQARMDLDRYRAAWAQHAIAKQQLDDQDKTAQAAEGTVKLDQGSVDYDRVQLAYCHITSPINGRIGLRLVDPGNVVVANATTALVVITQLRPISVVFPISEDQLGEVLAQPEHGAGLPVDVYDRVGTRELATGKLITIDNQIDTTTGTVRLRARFDNADDALFPNLFVNARLLVRTLRGATIVPSSAIQHNGDTAFVYAIADGRARVHTVTPGAVEGDDAQVTGIAPGTVVANSSFEKLRDKAPVQIAPPQQAGSAAGSGAARPAPGSDGATSPGSGGDS